MTGYVLKNTRWRSRKEEKLRPVAEVSKSKRCGKTQKETHANHKKVNQKVQGQTKMNCLYIVLIVVENCTSSRSTCFCASIWRQAQNVWRLALLRLHDDKHFCQAQVAPLTFSIVVYCTHGFMKLAAAPFYNSISCVSETDER